jgi:DNA invertase Pin-like site-specific DNA recombinase
VDFATRISLISRRTEAGLAAARTRGRLGGRPKKLRDPRQLALARMLYAGGETDIATTCTTLAISRATLYRALKARDNTRAPAPDPTVARQPAGAPGES